MIKTTVLTAFTIESLNIINIPTDTQTKVFIFTDKGKGIYFITNDYWSLPENLFSYKYSNEWAAREDISGYIEVTLDKTGMMVESIEVDMGGNKIATDYVLLIRDKNRIVEVDRRWRV